MQFALILNRASLKKADHIFSYIMVKYMLHTVLKNNNYIIGYENNEHKSQYLSNI
jgi:hypothetical protein